MWFDDKAEEAVELYTSLFPNSKITSTATLNDVPTPTKKASVFAFEIDNQPFMAINAGPVFKPNPSISFFLNFDPSKDKDAKEKLTKTYEKLLTNGKALMPLDKYPFSELYSWVQDRFGFSWQLILSNPNGDERPLVIPSLLFTNKVCGKAEEASDFYISIFKDSKRGITARYPKGMEPDKEGTIMYTDFQLFGQWFAAMDSAHAHDFIFNEAVSLLIPCETQQEIDYFWEKLSADPKAEQCGWLKDKYGVSWQVWPTALGEMMKSGTKEQIDRVTKAFLQMKKFDIAFLQKSYSPKYN